MTPLWRLACGWLTLFVVGTDLFVISPLLPSIATEFDLSATTAGLGVTVFVSIETGDHSQDWLDRFAKVVGAMPEVMEFYRMAGDVDYMLRVVVADIAGYDTFYKRLIAALPLKNVTSRFAMEKIKSTTALPIPEIRNQ